PPPAAAAATAATPAQPRWLETLARLLPIRSQFVCFGSIRDHVLLAQVQTPVLVPLLRALWETLQPLGFRFLVVWDPVDGVRAYPPNDETREAAKKLLDVPTQPTPLGLEALAQLVARVARLREARVALVIDHASRVSRANSGLDVAEHRFFVACEKASLDATPGNVAGSIAAAPLFNPVVWLANREQDLPSWFALDSERIETLAVPPPDHETRSVAARALGPLFAGFDEAAAADVDRYARAFGDATDGLSLAALADIAQLAAAQRLPLGRVDDAVRAYKVGALDNPWKKDHVRVKIRAAAEVIERRVKGQRQAVVKTIDILTRSVMGLTGAQAKGGGSRPRGVLFFAGPTGVGKTELAKTLTEVLFGDERAYIRFDMSEFAAEHSAARLLGAPPGYVGYDVGGELTNALRARPFSVVLFDEIEKAHPRLLDKFLQILEDGRLTDGRGQTAYFSEAVIVFTSNLGIVVEDESGQRVQSIKPGEPYVEIEARVRAAIADHFKFRLQRPELLNRIGDNIVVFDFIAPEVAGRIFDTMLGNVLARVRNEHGIALELEPAVAARLRQLCTEDLANGGRGIGNRLESVFINPLARALFALPASRPLRVVAVHEEDRIWSVELQPLGGAPANDTGDTTA
ncbi:MAG: AAA family ATPase, partial [Pseudomonadota bacterium]|nr:AAA family ATPase [Pseudomonadota bacterium]